MRSIVARRPSSIRSEGSRSVPGRSTSVAPRSKVTPSTVARSSPGTSSAPPGNALGRGPLAIGDLLESAVQADDLIRRGGQRPFQHRRYDGVLAGGLVTL